MSLDVQATAYDTKKYIKTSNGEVYEKPTFINCAAGTLTGYVAYQGVSAVYSSLHDKAAKGCRMQDEKFSIYDKKYNGKFTKAVNQMLEDRRADLERKGIKIYDHSYRCVADEAINDFFPFDPSEIDNTYTKHHKYQNEMVKEIQEAYVKKYGPTDFNLGFDLQKYAEESEAWIQKNPKKYAKVEKEFKIIEELMAKDMAEFGHIPSPVERFAAKKPKLYKRLMKSFFNTLKEIETYSDGRNACARGGNIHINMDKIPIALSHEIGHAYNAKSKGLFKLTNMLYPMSKLATPILLVALFRRKKVEGEESNTFVGKSLDFVKDNAVALTVATQVPKLAEEAAASVKGIKMMKNYLNKYEMSMLKKNLGAAYKTYLCSAMLPVAGVLAINLVRDFINKPKKVESPESVDKPFEQVA